MLLYVCLSSMLFCNIWAQTPNSTATFCGSPPDLLHARVTTTGETEGSTANYRCNDGYRESGSMQSICRGGLWVTTGSEPKCQELQCPSLPNVPHSSNTGRFGQQSGVGTVVRYNCFSGYRINVTDQVVCQPNQTWSLPTPVCGAKNCGYPPTSNNMIVNAPSTFYPSSATYSCRPGYKLVNPNQYGQKNPRSLTISCQYSGAWATAPTCQPVSCPRIPSVRFGYKLYGSSNLFGNVVVYSCNVGYTLQGNETITCDENGSWSEHPSCLIVKCSDPPAVANSTLTSTPTVNYGNSSSYHCNEGFYISGFSHVTCKADGTWTDPPTCNIVNCRSPPAILSGKHTWTSTTYKSKAVYSCNNGYKLIGVSEVTCLADGSWDSTPSCQSTVIASSRTDASSSNSGSIADSAATVASLAVAVAIMGLITLFFLLFFAFKIYPHKSRLFSYASYKNGDDTVNSNI